MQHFDVLFEITEYRLMPRPHQGRGINDFMRAVRRLIERFDETLHADDRLVQPYHKCLYRPDARTVLTSCAGASFVTELIPQGVRDAHGNRDGLVDGQG